MKFAANWVNLLRIHKMQQNGSFDASGYQFVVDLIKRLQSKIASFSLVIHDTQCTDIKVLRHKYYLFNMWHVFVYVCGWVGAKIKTLLHNLNLPDLPDLVTRHPILNFAKSSMLKETELMDFFSKFNIWPPDLVFVMDNWTSSFILIISFIDLKLWFS